MLNRPANTEIIPRPEGGGGDIGAPRCSYVQASGSLTWGFYSAFAPTLSSSCTIFVDGATSSTPTHSSSWYRRSPDHGFLTGSGTFGLRA